MYERQYNKMIYYSVVHRRKYVHSNENRNTVKRGKRLWPLMNRIFTAVLITECTDKAINSAELLNSNKQEDKHKIEICRNCKTGVQNG